MKNISAKDCFGNAVLDVKTFINKSDWADGPWHDEPDRVAWVDRHTGYPCIARRVELTGAWCGYVAVPKSHPLFGGDYNGEDFDVHGGLTFSGPCQQDNTERGICHPSNEKVWWFGFDCAHVFDTSPALDALLKSLNQTSLMDAIPSLFKDGSIYRELPYVHDQILKLAKQLKAREAKGWQKITMFFKRIFK